MRCSTLLASSPALALSFGAAPLSPLVAPTAMTFLRPEFPPGGGKLTESIRKVNLVHEQCSRSTLRAIGGAAQRQVVRDDEGVIATNFTATQVSSMQRTRLTRAIP